MPNLTIQGTKLNRVFDARVEILHDLDEDKKVREAVQVPVMQFTVTLPLDHDVMVAHWALAPQGPKRFKTVELQTLDRSHTVKKMWTLQKAYVHSYIEKEYPEGSTNGTDQGNFVEVVIRGVMIQNNVDYTGDNILAVQPGEPEAPAA